MRMVERSRHEHPTRSDGTVLDVDEKPDDDGEFGRNPACAFGPDSGCVIVRVGRGERNLPDRSIVQNRCPACQRLRIVKPSDWVADSLNGVPVTFVDSHEHACEGRQILVFSGADGAAHWSSTGMS